MSKEIDKNNYSWCYDLIKAPVMTEKFYGNPGKYTFIVDVDANKKGIKRAVENIFKVDVIGVNTLNRKGKQKRFKGIMGKRSKLKIAVIKIKPEQNIDLEAEV